MTKSPSLKELVIDPPPAPRRAGPPPQYLDLDKLKNADGIIAIISQRLSTRAITFALFKEFERDKRTERTSFIAASLRDSYVQMLELTLKRIEEISSDSGVMLDLQREAINKLPELADQEHAARVLQIPFRKRG